MRTKRFFAVAFTPILLLAGLLLTGCDYQVARSDLNGRWLSFGGRYSLELANGRFTRELPVVGTQTGTYETSGRYITLHRRGYSPETFRFSLRFPTLVLETLHGQETTFYHDSPRMPDSLLGTWLGFRGLWTEPGVFMPFVFYTEATQRGNPLVLEGRLFLAGTYRGAYTIRSRNLPNSSVLTIEMTHIGGSLLFNRVFNMVPVHLFDFFDWEWLQEPLPGEADVWFSQEEVTWFFLNAAERAGQVNIAYQRQIMFHMDAMLGELGTVTEYYYVVDEDPGVVYDFWGDVVGDNALLTWKNRETGAIRTFMRDGQ